MSDAFGRQEFKDLHFWSKKVSRMQNSPGQAKLGEREREREVGFIRMLIVDIIAKRPVIFLIVNLL